MLCQILKYMRQLLAILLLCCVGTASSCRKRGNDAPPGPTLPPITDTGANTFGCLVDGELFLPSPVKGSWRPPLTCTYQEISSGLVFTLSAASGSTKKAFVFNCIALKLRDTVLNYLSPSEERNLSARYGVYTNKEYATYDNCPGEFHLTRFDQVYGIASGTFWFDAVDTTTHDTIHVREGRFDVKYRN